MTPTDQEAGNGTIVDRFFQRAALRPGVVRPLVSWLYENAGTERDECITAIESWLVRVRLTRRNPGNHADFMTLREQVVEAEPQDRLRIIVERLPHGWPSNDDVRCAVISNRMEKARHREMARMVLEAIEIWRGGKTPSTELEIEHIMPLGWEVAVEDWPLCGETKDGRDQAVVTLGNLTLTECELNRKLGTKKWPCKRNWLKRCDALCLNKELLKHAGKVWNVEAIRERGHWLACHICAIWPCAEHFRQGCRGESDESCRP